MEKAPRELPEIAETAAKRAAVLEGIVDADAGRLVAHGAVRRWLKSWETGQRLPRPE